MDRVFDTVHPVDGPGADETVRPPADGIDRSLLAWFAGLSTEERLAWLDEQQRFVALASTATRVGRSA